MPFSTFQPFCCFTRRQRKRSDGSRAAIRIYCCLTAENEAMISLTGRVVLAGGYGTQRVVEDVTMPVDRFDQFPNQKSFLMQAPESRPIHSSRRYHKRSTPLTSKIKIALVGHGYHHISDAYICSKPRASWVRIQRHAMK